MKNFYITCTGSTLRLAGFVTFFLQCGTVTPTLEFLGTVCFAGFLIVSVVFAPGTETPESANWDITTLLRMLGLAHLFILFCNSSIVAVTNKNYLVYMLRRN